MLKQTKKIRELYEDIQRKLFYMIPEKWDKLCLYASIIDDPDEDDIKGELFFYYIPKGIFRKNPVNVYEIPSKFNLNESEYLKLVEILYMKIKHLREEFIKKSEGKEMWSNLTMTIQDASFRVEYNYEDLKNCEFSSYERHIIWRYKYLGIGPEQVNKQEKEILKKYESGAKTVVDTEVYEAGIYIRDIKNMIDFDTEGYDEPEEIEYEIDRPKKIKKKKNQILSLEDEDKNKKTKY